MKAFLITAAAIALSTSPVSAQLLGGGGPGGGIGGSLGGTGSLGGMGSMSGGSLGGMGGGNLGGTFGGAGDRIRNSTNGTLSGSGTTSGTQRIDRKSGTVAVDRTMSGAVGGAASQTFETPRRSIDMAGSGTASGSGTVAGNAQLVGTDAVRSTTSDARSNLRDTAAATRSTARSTVGETRGATRSFANGARTTATNGVATTRAAVDASASNAVMAANNQLAIAGSAAASAAGAFPVSPGMVIQSAKGKTIGTVRNVVTDSRGKVRSVVVESKDRLATLPAGNFSGSGDVLVTGMTQGEITKMSKAQAKDGGDTPSS